MQRLCVFISGLSLTPFQAVIWQDLQLCGSTLHMSLEAPQKPVKNVIGNTANKM